MKAFFLILFFSKTVLLTPVPVDISGEMVIHTNELLEAITPGANIQIDVSDFTGRASLREKGIIELRKSLRGKIPEGSVKAMLHSTQGERISLEDAGFAISSDGARIILAAPSGIPTNIFFNKVVITSRVDLRGVRVVWRNYTH